MGLPKGLITGVTAAEGMAAIVSFDRPVIDVLWYRRRKGGVGIDRDNAIGSLKGAADGLADAKVYGNDSAVRWGEVDWAVDADDPRVMLRVRNLNTGRDGT